MNTATAGRVRTSSSKSSRSNVGTSFLIGIGFALILVMVVVMFYATIWLFGARPVGMSHPAPIATPMSQFPAVPTPLPTAVPPAPVAQAPQPDAPASEFPDLPIPPWYLWIWWPIAAISCILLIRAEREFPVPAIPVVGAILMTVFCFWAAKAWEFGQQQYTAITTNDTFVLELGIGVILLVIFAIVSGKFSAGGWGALVGTCWVFLPFGIYFLSGGITFWLLEVGIFLGWAAGMAFSTSYSDKTKMPAEGMPKGTTVDYARRFNNWWERRQSMGSRSPDRDQVATGSYGWFAIAIFSSLASIFVYWAIWQFPMHIGVVLAAWCFFAFFNSRTRMKKSDAAPGNESMRQYGLIFTLAGVAITLMILGFFGLIK